MTQFKQNGFFINNMYILTTRRHFPTSHGPIDPLEDDAHLRYTAIGNIKCHVPICWPTGSWFTWKKLCPFQPSIATCRLQLVASKMHKEIILVAHRRFSVADLGAMATENLQLTTELISTCIFSPWVATDKLQRMAGMDFLLVLSNRWPLHRIHIMHAIQIMGIYHTKARDNTTWKYWSLRPSSMLKKPFHEPTIFSPTYIWPQTWIIWEYSKNNMCSHNTQVICWVMLWISTILASPKLKGIEVSTYTPNERCFKDSNNLHNVQKTMVRLIVQAKRVSCNYTRRITMTHWHLQPFMDRLLNPLEDDATS